MKITLNVLHSRAEKIQFFDILSIKLNENIV